MRKLASAAVLAGAALLATPALAQDSDDWTGFYVGGQLGYGFQSGGNNETILFDTNLDGNFGDTVNTAAPANAFSPGFCGEAANGPTPADGCDGDRDGLGQRGEVPQVQLGEQRALVAEVVVDERP